MFDQQQSVPPLQKQENEDGTGERQKQITDLHKNLLQENPVTFITCDTQQSFSRPKLQGHIHKVNPHFHRTKGLASDPQY